MLSIPSGFLISTLLRKSVLSLLQEKITSWNAGLTLSFGACKEFCDCTRKLSKTAEKSEETENNEQSLELIEESLTRVSSTTNNHMNVDEETVQPNTNDNISTAEPKRKNETMEQLAFNTISLLINIRTIFEDLIEKNENKEAKGNVLSKNQ